MTEWVIIDTCIWAAFFGKPAPSEKAAVDALLDDDRVAILGPILAEVLLGFRRKDQSDWVASRLRQAHELAIEWEDWREAANLGRNLIANGDRLPLTDLVVATVAIRHDVFVYSTDPHFDRIPNLKRFSPST
jgi:predicted nucleic acid-binding protein